MAATFTAQHEEDLQDIALELLQAQSQPGIFTLKGPLGVGKTTFIKYFCQCLGVQTPVQSPSFAIANEYKVAPGQSKVENTGQIVYHLDLYRVKDDKEALEAGLEYYIYDNKYCFIEWPEIIVHLLPDRHVAIQMELTAENARKIIINPHE